MKTKILVATLLAGLTSYSFAASNAGATHEFIC